MYQVDAENQLFRSVTEYHRATVAFTQPVAQQKAAGDEYGEAARQAHVVPDPHQPQGSGEQQLSQQGHTVTDLAQPQVRGQQAVRMRAARSEEGDGGSGQQRQAVRLRLCDQQQQQEQERVLQSVAVGAHGASPRLMR